MNTRKYLSEKGLFIAGIVVGVAALVVMITDFFI